MQFEFGFMNYETPQGSQEYMPQNIGRAPVKEDRLSQEPEVPYYLQKRLEFN